MKQEIAKLSAALQAQQERSAASTSSVAPPAAQLPTSNFPPRLPMNFSGGDAGRRCWICGRVEGAGLAHAIGIRNCPETAALIKEGLLTYSPMTGRLVRGDGGELPAMQLVPNGLASLLRDAARREPVRDLPPHQAACRSIGLVYDNQPVISYPPAASSSAHNFYSFPVTTRAQSKSKGKSVQIGRAHV